MLRRLTILICVAAVTACASSGSSDSDTSNISPTEPAPSPSGSVNTSTGNAGNAGTTDTTTSSTPSQPAPAPGAASNASGSAIVTEIEQTLGVLKETHYQHTTNVDAADGIFDVDCSGFLDYVLEQAAPDQLTALTSATTSERPLAKDYVSFLAGSPTADSGWTSIATVAELTPGDVIAWLLPPGASDTGHVMVVRNAPRMRDASSYIVQVWDSVDSPHGSTDSRAATHATGIGYGDVVLIVDANGAPAAHAWSDGGPQVKQQTALGRAL